MISKICSFGFQTNKFSPQVNNNPKSNKQNQISTSDMFCKSIENGNSNSSCIISFMGAKATLATKAKQSGNMLLTKGINEYNDAVKKLNIPKDKYTQSLFQEIANTFEKVSDKLDSARLRLKLGLKEAEYAQKANIMGNLYTQMGNLTGNPKYFQKAHDLFEEASLISKKNLIKAQSEYQTYDANEQVLYNVLHPQPKKNPIGFQHPEESNTIAAKASNNAQGKTKIGFI